VSRGFNETAPRQREAVTAQNRQLEETLKGRGLAVNTTEPEPFRDTLRKAGYYAEWKRRYGEEAWSLLEGAVGRLA
jgi:TRAP-type C4-dicarboxylate transport system substrate-binding protein